MYKPPSKNFPSMNSWTPTSSTPIPTKRTLCSSNCGLMPLSCLAAKRQKAHPKRRKNVITQAFSSHKDLTVISYWQKIYKYYTNKEYGILFIYYEIFINYRNKHCILKFSGKHSKIMATTYLAHYSE